MSRRRDDEIAFGSDAFLDVVCNLVGILIVLIIVAGLRISRAPVEIEVAEDSTAVTDVVAIEPPVEEVEPEPLVLPPLPSPEPVVLPPAEPPRELVAEADQLQSQLQAMQTELEQAQAEQAALARQRSGVETQLATVAQQVEAARERMSAVEQSVAERESTVREQERLVAAARLQLQFESQAAPESPVLAHRVTPIGRQVADQVEVHFRLSGGRVSVVPIDALASDLKDRVERHRDMLFRVPRYEGAIGPVDGFTMHYVIERQQATALEELRNGGPVLRIGLSYYEIEAKPDAPSESIEEVLLPRSRFRSALAQAGPHAILTFWVYPDSFELNRQLQELVHSGGYEVASRPLPHGVPIAGSPNGSKSVAQ